LFNDCVCLAILNYTILVILGKYKISWITDVKEYSGTSYWVGFMAFKADNTHTDWMWPDSDFRQGRYVRTLNIIPDKSIDNNLTDN
jgi:hypothetical protein